MKIMGKSARGPKHYTLNPSLVITRRNSMLWVSEFSELDHCCKKSIVFFRWKSNKRQGSPLKVIGL